MNKNRIGGLRWRASKRRFIRLTLAQNPDLRIVGEVSDGLEAVRTTEALQPDLILLDLGLPTLDGLAAARQIRTLSPQSKVIFVTQEADPDVVREALYIVGGVRREGKSSNRSARGCERGS